MMDAVDKLEPAHGIFPAAIDRCWHCGAHLTPTLHGPVHAMDSGKGNAGFVLLRHSTETGDDRRLTFCSLFIYPLPLAEYNSFGHDGTRLPGFLCRAAGPDFKGQVTPAAAGGDCKVRSKNVIAFPGRYADVTHLYFKIFTTSGDFDAYFGHTRFGNAAPYTLTSAHCWGHAYYTIPAGHQFLALPPGADEHDMPHGIGFAKGHAGTNTRPLVVDAYSSKWTRYTKVSLSPGS